MYNFLEMTAEDIGLCLYLMENGEYKGQFYETEYYKDSGTTYKIQYNSYYDKDFIVSIEETEDLELLESEEK